ncbi:MAG: metal-dependent transcriptional regulator [Halobacteriales archaeon]|nr:metal-dependent transcriptional regulator [Halobacteriales archaeon]
MLSAVMEDYLKAIYELQERGDGERVTTSAIAARVDVTPPTVTSMLEKLEGRELIEREKYKGVRLTPRGETVALEVIRHHRLLEAYLTQALDYDWSEVHDEADALEHHISEEFEQRIADVLGDPTVDPHGDPIPTAELDPLEDPEGSTLAEYDPGAEVIIRRVSDRDPEELRYLADHGVTPGTRIEVIEVAPFGMVTVQPTDGTGEAVSLPEAIAAGVRVAPVAEEPA